MSSSETRDDHGIARLWLHVPAETSELSGIRRSVRDYVVTAGGAGAVADDLELVVSELATNVLEHTDSQTLTVALERSGDDWVLDVADVDDLDILDNVSLPDQHQVTGRGLFVVASLVDDLRIVEDGGRCALRCRRRFAGV
jgi:serine/threonine-protein kinase RsbW